MKRFFKFAGIFCLLANGALWANPPAWWTDESTRILDPNATPSVLSNHAPVLAGQLKNVAKNAKAYLDAQLPGGAGSQIDTLIESFQPGNGISFTAEELLENHGPVNLGQLKAVAKKFYDRLIAEDFDTTGSLIAHGYPPSWTSAYPWLEATSVAENHSPANIGQLKILFSFDVQSGPYLLIDTDHDGLPDWWEDSSFGGLVGNATDDSNGNGLTNVTELVAGGGPPHLEDTSSLGLVLYTALQ